MKGADKMTSREDCRALKEMRRAYVRAEKLDLIIADCDFRGECPEICPSLEAERRAISRLLARKVCENACEDFDDGTFTLKEWMDVGRNTEIVVISCIKDECNTINCELEEFGLTECTF